MEDTFIREHIEGKKYNSLYQMNKKKIIIFNFKDLLRNIRTQVLVKLIKPYTKIHIPFIAKVYFIFFLILLFLKKKLIGIHFN